jgi:hypothetical protein
MTPTVEKIGGKIGGKIGEKNPGGERAGCPLKTPLQKNTSSRALSASGSFFSREARKTSA